MRHIRKRVTCVNRGHTHEQQEANKVAIYKIIARYIKKMQAKGWIFDGDYSLQMGNAMFKYEAIIPMHK